MYIRACKNVCVCVYMYCYPHLQLRPSTASVGSGCGVVSVAGVLYTCQCWEVPGLSQCLPELTPLLLWPCSNLSLSSTLPLSLLLFATPSAIPLTVIIFLSLSLTWPPCCASSLSKVPTQLFLSHTVPTAFSHIATRFPLQPLSLSLSIE